MNSDSEEDHLSDDDFLREVYWDKDIEIFLNKGIGITCEEIEEVDTRTADEIEKSLKPTREEELEEAYWDMDEYLKESLIYQFRNLPDFIRFVEEGEI